MPRRRPGRGAGCHQPEPDAAQPQHGVVFVEAGHGVEQAYVVRVGCLPGRSLGGDALGQLGAVRQEFVQGRVEQADGHRQPVHGGENAGEVFALQGEQVVQGLLAVCFG